MSRCGLIHKDNNCRIYSIVGLLVGICLAMGSQSCGSGGSSGSVAIAFATGALAPPSSLALSGTSSFAAIVTGDPGALGVNWTVTCVPAPIPQGSCGTITEHTASGYPTTYFAPINYDEQTVPVNGTVTITGASSADPTKTVSVTIQVTPTPPISIGFNEAPPASMLTGATANLVAVVSNDSTNAGADFTLTCGSSLCGTIVPAHTSGIVGAFTVFTAPDIVPADGAVTITAASTADPTQTVSATVTIKQAHLSITLSQAPTPNLPVGASTNLTAVVTFDPSNAGVDWTVSCQSTSCGSFNPAHTASGQLTIYTAPPTVPTGGVVTITAASTTTPTTTVSAQVTITPPNLRNSLLNGRYAFLLQGVRAGGPWAIAGSLFADGVGNINVATERFLGDNNTYSVSGTYFIGSDGVGTITLNGAPTGLGYWYNGQQIFQVSAVSSGLLSMEEFDGYYDPALRVAYGGTLSGTLQQQSAAGFQPLSPSDSFCFLLSGVGPQDVPAFYGGVLSGSTLIFDMDRSIGGAIDSISGQTSFNSVSSDGSSGNIVMGPYSFGYFVISSSQWILIAGAGSTDLPAGNCICNIHSLLRRTSSHSPRLGRRLCLKGTPPLALGGLLNLDAQGNMTGLMDANIDGTVASAQISGNLSISSSGPTQGRGVLTVTGGAAQQFAFYPTAHNGALLLELDPQMSGVGVALPQTTGSSAAASLFSGTYAAAYQTIGEINVANGGVGSWNDFLGLITADGVSDLTGSMAVDQFDESSGAFWTQTPDATLSGSFSVGEGGRFPGSFTVPPLATSQQIFYILDNSTVLSLGLDSEPSTGILQLQQFGGVTRGHH